MAAFLQISLKRFFKSKIKKTRRYEKDIRRIDQTKFVVLIVSGGRLRAEVGYKTVPYKKKIGQ